MGLEQRLAEDRLRLNLAWFDNSYRNIISTRTISFNPFTSQYFNIGLTTARGAELSGDVALVSGFRAKAGYTFTDSEIVESTSTSAVFRPGNWAFRRPRHSGFINFAWNGARASIDLRGCAGRPSRRQRLLVAGAGDRRERALQHLGPARFRSAHPRTVGHRARSTTSPAAITWSRWDIRSSAGRSASAFGPDFESSVSQEIRRPGDEEAIVFPESWAFRRQDRWLSWAAVYRLFLLNSCNKDKQWRRVSPGR